MITSLGHKAKFQCDQMIVMLLPKPISFIFPINIEHSSNSLVASSWDIVKDKFSYCDVFCLTGPERWNKRTATAISWLLIPNTIRRILRENFKNWRSYCIFFIQIYSKWPIFIKFYVNYASNSSLAASNPKPFFLLLYLL